MMAVWHDAVLDPPKLTIPDPNGQPIRTKPLLVVVENARGFRDIRIDTFTRSGGWLYTSFDEFENENEKVTHWMPMPALPKKKGGCGG